MRAPGATAPTTSMSRSTSPSASPPGRLPPPSTRTATTAGGGGVRHDPAPRAAELGPRLGPVVEAEHRFDDGRDVVGHVHLAGAATVAAAGVLPAAEEDAERLAHRRDGAREH